jgi:hypothetical protein
MFCVCLFVQVRTSLDGSRSRLREYQIAARIEDDEYDGLFFLDDLISDNS